jgi:hypothetical protein
MVDGACRSDGDELSVTITDGRGTSPVQRSHWSIDGSTLKQTSQGQSRLLTRISAPSRTSSPLVGVWSYPHRAGGTAYEEYASDGRFLFRLPMRTALCRWSLEGNHIRVSAEGQTKEATWRIDRDRLTLESASGTESFRHETVGILKSR